ncbi:capsule biosynthesis protein [Pelobium manganitolerans]|uniref:Capsule biosynthesis protein n=1 Tax=Pelobium manganitolerans TaxID=1842495 RepID=A0A419SCA3_9SPHI|nr:SLBB domain-containing protein [Pelobium manganitolerans]RKD20445.1 capsule biosynthesis protein [Pelobium manganitolerans]
MNYKKLFYLLIFAIGLAVNLPSAKAQSITQQNFSNVRVDELTDDQIRQIIKQVESSGLPESQLEQMAAARGMQPSEIAKLRARVEAVKAKNSASGDTDATVKGKDGSRSRSFEGEVEEIANSDDKKTENEADAALQALKSKIFGKELFANASTTFEPNLRLATPLNYVIGTTDQLLIDIYGYSEANYKLTVSPEGTINIPYAGIITVGGLTVEAATARIRSKLSPIYSGLNSGNTKLSVTIGNIRSIKVILTGEVMKPGTYTLPSLATLFNALYSSGGPTDNGSFRNIEVIRNGKKVGTLDVYDFLLRGDLKNNIRLQDQDLIRVPVYQKRVEIVGEVKRPAIFEMKSNETFKDLLAFAGGFTERAYKARVKVLGNTDTERKISDILAKDFDSYVPQSGDKYFVNEILDRFENRVTIEGAVFRPGQYELEPGMSLKTLIQKAEGLKEDAFTNRAYITRLTDDLNTELIPFDARKIMNGTVADIPLKREDVISISSIFDLREEYKVTINGEVRRPGEFGFSENMSLGELILKAGGFSESATPQRIEISRRVKNSDATSASARTAEVFQVDADRNLSLEASKFILEPFDIVTVRSSPGYETQKQVKIEGEVLYPGYYTITKKDERISDLIKRAGGLTALSFTDGASLKRAGNFDSQLEQEKENQKVQQFRRIQKNAKDSTALDVENLAVRNNFVGIDLTRILEKPGTKKDLFLENGDIINVPRQLQTVKVSGEVLSPNTVIFDKNKGFKSYIANAGGFSQNALKRRSYIIYANGSVRSTKKFLFFNNYPIVRSGAEIFVPKQEERRRLTPTETVGIISGLASFGAIVLGVMNLLK